MPVPTDEIKRARALRRWFGRPTTAQNRLLEHFLAALVVDFEEGGQEAIRRVREDDPVNYLRLVAVMVPKPVLDLTAGSRFSDEDVADALAQVRQMGEAHAACLGAGVERAREP